MATAKKFNVPMRKQLASHIWPMLLNHLRTILREGAFFSVPSAVEVVELDAAWNARGEGHAAVQSQNVGEGFDVDKVKVYEDVFFQVVKVPCSQGIL